MQTGDFAVPPELAASGVLPSPPGVVLEIMRIVNDEDSTVQELGRVIENDPVLAANLLGTANSALYNLVREIHSIRDAVVLLGFRAVRSLALGVSVAEAVPANEQCEWFDLGLYWRHSIMTAALAKGLATKAARPLAEEAFLIGLIGNLGRLVVANALPDRYGPVLQQTPWPSGEIESAALGFTTAGVTAAILHRWGLPDSLCHAAGNLEHPHLLPDDLDPSTTKSGRIAAAANTATSRLLNTTESTPVEEIAGELSATVDLDSTVTHEVLESTSEQLPAVGNLIAASLPEGLHPNELLGQAQDLLHQAAA